MISAMSLFVYIVHVTEQCVENAYWKYNLYLLELFHFPTMPKFQ